MEDGYLEGLVIGCLLCGIIAWITFLHSKREAKAVNSIAERFSDEDLRKLVQPGFSDYEENANFLIGSSIIYEINENEASVEVHLLFYDSFYKKYQICSLLVDKETYRQKDLKVGQIVTTLHNKRREVWLKVRTIL